MTSPTPALQARQSINAATAQAEAGDFSGLPTLIEALDFPHHDVRLRAAYCLQRIGASAAVDALACMALKDSVSPNRNQAIWALAASGRLAAVPPLIDALADSDADRRDDARAALHQLLGDAVLRLTADETEGPDPAERERIAAWWQQHRDDFDPAQVYAFGEPASPAVFIRRMKGVRSTLPDAWLDALRDWTGQDFGTAPLSKVIAQWDHWWSAHQDAYEAGRRYFCGRPVP